MEANCLPKHGPITCRRCWDGCKENERILANGAFKLVNDPAAWGASRPRVLVLGLTKGNTQSSAMANVLKAGGQDYSAFDAVPFKNFRDRLAEALSVVGLFDEQPDVSERMVSQEATLAWGSLVRCSLTAWDAKKQEYTGESGKVLSGLSRREVKLVYQNCVAEFLSSLPKELRLIVLLGNGDRYLREVRDLVRVHYPDLRNIPGCGNVAFEAGERVWVHVGHPSRGNGYFGAFIRGDASEGQGMKRELAKAAISAARSRFHISSV